mgnify:CR=1 FL=1|tara:strand:+ start:61347 stop:61601 length:255 start_codon:yes stop_codon:yes gene_type:complete
MPTPNFLLRQAFYEAIENDELSLGQALKRMRKIAGKTQPEFAKFVDVAPRIITDIERGVANPTIETLNKIGRAFGLVAGFQRVS